MFLEAPPSILRLGNLDPPRADSCPAVLFTLRQLGDTLTVSIFLTNGSVAATPEGLSASRDGRWPCQRAHRAATRATSAPGGDAGTGWTPRNRLAQHEVIEARHAGAGALLSSHSASGGRFYLWKRKIPGFRLLLPSFQGSWR